MICFNPWDHQKLEKIKATYQTRSFLKVGVFTFMKSTDPADATNGDDALNVQPQTTIKPVSVDQTHLAQCFMFVVMPSTGARRVCVGFRHWILTNSAVAP